MQHCGLESAVTDGFASTSIRLMVLMGKRRLCQRSGMAKKILAAMVSRLRLHGAKELSEFFVWTHWFLVVSFIQSLVFVSVELHVCQSQQEPGLQDTWVFLGV